MGSENKLKILFVTTKVNFERAGGSVPDLDCKVKEMQHYGADVSVLTVYSHMNERPLSVPYAIEEENVKSGSLPRIQWDVFRFLRTHDKDVDVIHIEGQFAYAAALYRIFGGKPVVAFFNRELTVWDEHHTLKLKARRFLEQFLFRFLVGYIDHLYFTAPTLHERYVHFGLRTDHEQITILIDLFDPARMREVASSIQREQSDTLRVFASGRMVQQKGFHLLVEAVEKLPQHVRERVHVTIGGDGEERERLIKTTKEKGLEKNISFPGWLSKEDFWKQLAAHDIFVLPRWRIEMPSIIVMEAVALGIPALVPGGGAVEWMTGNAAATFADGDPDSLSRTLAHIITSPEERMKLSGNARTRWEALHYRPRSRVLWDMLVETARAK